MLSRIVLALVASLATAGATQAEVLAAGPVGFNLRIVTTTKADPLIAFEAFTRIEKWWDPSHTYTGNAANLSLNMRPGGAFLEATASGTWVKHLEVVYVSPGKEIRFLGGLGPLQSMGLHGALDVQFEPIEGGGTRMVMTYNVSGYSQTGLENLAQIVDRVQTRQMQRHSAYADRLAASD
jgi:uncharacterized protein YndB with AHSA1/START domain